MLRCVGQEIGSNSIEIQYQQPIIDLTAGTVLQSLEGESAATDSMKLGDFDTKSASSSGNISSQAYFDRGKKALDLIGRKVIFFKANG